MRLHCLLTTAQALLATVSAFPSSSTAHYAVLEQRSDAAHTESFSKIGRLDPATVVPVSIAVKQRNLHLGHDLLLEVSDPTSPKYGQHWSPAEIAQVFAPEPDLVKSIYQWVMAAGIPKKDVTFSATRGVLEFKADVATLEGLLQTEYWVYQDENSGQTHLGCDDYKVPAKFVEHIDYINPTILFGQRGNVISKRNAPMLPTRSLQSFEPTGSNPDLSNCSASTTLDCIHALYNIPYASQDDIAHPNNSYAISGLLSGTWHQSDLDIFFARYFPRLTGKPPILELVDSYNKINSTYNELESNLDLMLAMPLSYPLNVTFIQVGDINSGGDMEYLLEALDASFCDNGTTYPGDGLGDDFPSPFPGGWNETDQCGTLAIPKVISTSYYSQEEYHTEPFMRRQCDEFLKLGLMGVTILYCSGDRGVGGVSDECSHGQFGAGWPSSCPYVTSVGATRLRPNSTIADGEIVCDDVISSGGGFSNIFDMPSYQRAQVNTWWDTHPENYTQFNTSRLSRGFPDISAIGHQIEVVLGGGFSQVYGTSASTPLIGALISRINDARLKMGKGTVGFINPTLYAHPEVFNDITEGSNSGCGTDGFHAIRGWDPATGMGTPDFEGLRGVFVQLP